MHNSSSIVGLYAFVAIILISKGIGANDTFFVVYPNISQSSVHLRICSDSRSQWHLKTKNQMIKYLGPQETMRWEWLSMAHQAVLWAFFAPNWYLTFAQWVCK